MKNKNVLVIICILFVVSLSLSVLGFVNHNKDKESNQNQIVNDEKETKEEKTNNIENNTNEGEKQNQIVDDNSVDTTEEESDDEEDDEESDLLSIDSCEISSIKGVNVALKNTKKKGEYELSSDVYINDKLSGSVTYLNHSDNTCKKINKNVLEINNGYFLFRFSSELHSFSDYFLFGNNGKYITNFEELQKKYSYSNDSSLFYTINVEKNNNGSLLIKYSTYRETEFLDVYCENKLKPEDIYEINETVSVIDDKLVVDNIEKITYEEAYKCKDGNTDDCGDISKTKCNN